MLYRMIKELTYASSLHYDISLTVANHWNKFWLMEGELFREPFIKYNNSGTNTMISPKMVALTALMAATSLGAYAVPALAQEIVVEQERGDNINDQFIAQSNEACTNTVAAFESGSGDQDVYAEQKNKCYVEQSNYADQDAFINDYSYTENFADVFQVNDDDE